MSGRFPSAAVANAVPRPLTPRPLPIEVPGLSRVKMLGSYLGRVAPIVRTVKLNLLGAVGQRGRALPRIRERAQHIRLTRSA